ncbi:glxK [Acrasis kona]|uniref:GlxK n=1 Tax=Acrasis kona TaxID=1008807 RepID=A0AAW2ZC25_9EUKA
MQKGKSNEVKVLCCTDKFKDSLGAYQIGEVVLRTLVKNFGNVQTVNIPLSDGGDGFIHAISQGISGSNNSKMNVKTHTVTGPLCNSISSEYAIVQNNLGRNLFAVLEMAKTSGLQLVPVNSRNPMNTTTKGLGELIKKLHDEDNISTILLGIGGSATNDAGLGALQALGVKTVLHNGEQPETLCGKHLKEIKSIDVSNLTISNNLEINISCDVTNPFIGENGAVHTFGKQKGLITKEQRDEMESAMVHVSGLLKQSTGIDVSTKQGAGAAGGIAGGFFAVMNSNVNKNKGHSVVLKSGVNVISDFVDLERNIKEADVIVTGEGCYDEQTAQGKVVSHVEMLCDKYNKPCVVLCGKNENLNSKSVVLELMSMFPFEESMNHTAKCIETIIEKNLHLFSRHINSSL